eukprot:GDKJ01002647.1.p1 GENE.GDKJ01002647.1~~GDKJ01002647.1.p1  ORF type:complete len:115 (+),score=0.20 GDKJ01002647.1:24-368(+)
MPALYAKSLSSKRSGPQLAGPPQPPLHLLPNLRQIFRHLRSSYCPVTTVITKHACCRGWSGHSSAQCADKMSQASPTNHKPPNPILTRFVHRSIKFANFTQFHSIPRSDLVRLK